MRPVEMGNAPADAVPMTIRALFYAHYQDITGHRELLLTVPPGTTVRALADLLTRTYPPLGDLLATGRAALGPQFASPGDLLTDGCELAFLPPVSGGC